MPETEEKLQMIREKYGELLDDLDDLEKQTVNEETPKIVSKSLIWHVWASFMMSLYILLYPLTLRRPKGIFNIFLSLILLVVVTILMHKEAHHYYDKNNKYTNWLTFVFSLWLIGNLFLYWGFSKATILFLTWFCFLLELCILYVRSLTFNYVTFVSFSWLFLMTRYFWMGIILGLIYFATLKTVENYLKNLSKKSCTPSRLSANLWRPFAVLRVLCHLSFAFIVLSKFFAPHLLATWGLILWTTIVSQLDVKIINMASETCQKFGVDWIV
ncbi:MAG: hypothetical protein LBP21_05225 [Synergistaceae bacterium]|jgi:hypothetical protein|nr:hypothetical protein [Synergistaceae bacterium]